MTYISDCCKAEARYCNCLECQQDIQTYDSCALRCDDCGEICGEFDEDELTLKCK